MIGKLRSLRDDDRGAAIIELALLAPMFAAIIVGMTDLSRGYSTKLQLEQAAQRTIEKAQQTQVDETMIATLQAEGAAAAGVPATAVTVDYWLECDGVKQADYDTLCSAGQSYARYLTVELVKSFTPMFSTRFTGAKSDGSYEIHGKAGLRTQ